MPRRARWKDDLDAWVSEMEAQNVPDATIRTYKGAVRRAWTYGERAGWPAHPAKVEPSHVRQYLEHLRRYPPCTQATYGNGLLQFLRRWNGKFEKFRLRIRPERVNVDWLTVEEVALALATAANPRTLAMEVLMAYTGIRVGELLSLRMCDLHEDYISVVGKRSKARNIPVTPEFWQALEPYMEWRRRQDGLLFLLHPSRDGPVPYCYGSVRNNLVLHAKRLGRHLSPHTFRRSYGRHLYKMGMPLPEIQRLYGHASVEMTIRYLGIVQEDLASSLAKFQPSYLR
jgi:integrase